MTKRLLLTSFSPWKPHQINNSSDQLLGEVARIPDFESSLHFLRYLPVNLPIARDLTIFKIEQWQPDLVICCGMAESRHQLQVESQATVGQDTLKTRLNLAQLVSGIPQTTISHDAGRFVCNSLYHAILYYLQTTFPDRDGLFIHVPLLTATNREPIISDFCLLLERLLSKSSP